MNHGWSLARRVGARFVTLFVVLAVWPALLWRPAGAAEIVINEVMSRNATNAPFAQIPDYAPDYVELYNTTTNDIDLAAGGWTLSTKANPFVGDFKDFYHFPTGTVIAADSYLLVMFDNETNLPGLHTTFTTGGTNVTLTLNRSADRVRLFKQGNVFVDGVAWGPQIENLSVGRVPDFTGGFTLTRATPAGGTAAYSTNVPVAFTPAPTVTNEVSLKINEWMGTNSAGWDKDWLELYNPDTNIVNLSGLVLVDKVANLAIPAESRPIPALSFIAPLGFVQLFCTKNADTNAPANELAFSISSDTREDIFLYAADKATRLDHVESDQPRRDKTQGRIPDGGAVYSGILPNTSPEESNFASIPEVVINEVLTHTDLPLEDAIELMNTTEVPQNIGHWWLTNQRDNPKKYKIPANTILAPGGFVVFYESQFNNSATAAQPFTLNSANGDECYLYKADASGKLLGYRRGISFGPAANGVSFIRHVVTNYYETNVDIVASTRLTLGTSIKPTDSPGLNSVFRTGTGAENADPALSAVVINEVHYHPPALQPGGEDDTITEFIELYNTSEEDVLLYDPNQYFADRTYNPAPDGTTVPINSRYADGRTNTWRIRGEVSYEFPENSRLEPGKFALIVNFDPTDNLFLANFTNTFPALAERIPSEVRLYGPYRGKLSNKSATVELRRPDAPQGPTHPDFRLVPYITADKIDYTDDAPWPTNGASEGPDGLGQSIQKLSSYVYGNNGEVWIGALPTPGGFNSSTGFEPPSILSHPTNLTVTAGKTATFRVTTRGTLLNYQWYSNGVAMAGANSASFSLVNVSTNTTGSFLVIVTNITGSVTSNPALLVVNPPQNDTTAPTVSITSPAAGIITNEIIVVSGKASDKSGISAVYYSVNGGTYLPATGSATFDTWGPVVVTLIPGTNTVSVYSVDHAGNSSTVVTRTYVRVLKDALALTVNGNGTVKGATNGQQMELGRSFTLTATPAAGHVFSNWTAISAFRPLVQSSAPTLTYLMSSNTTVTANFVPNPFGVVAGKYHGLFYENDETNGVQHGSSGHFILTTTAGGGYSAALLGGGLKLSASGQLDLDGRATNTIPRKGTNALTVTWHVDLSGSDTVSGTVTDGSWTADLGGDRAVYSKTNPCTQAGKYTFVLPGLPGDSFVPGGASYGTVSIDSNGVVTLKGYLSDKTGASQKGQISKNGEWPLYVPLYSNKGSLLSWIAFTNRSGDDFNGLLNWAKPANPKNKLYPLGFTTNTVELLGSRYSAPVGTNKVLTFTTAELVLSGGNLDLAYTNSFNIGLGSRVTNVGPHRLTLSFTPATGLFKGSLTPTNAGTKAIAFSGAVLAKANYAAGYFLGTNQSGTAVIFDTTNGIPTTPAGASGSTGVMGPFDPIQIDFPMNEVSPRIGSPNSSEPLN